jgi:hypothetical protein
MRKSLAVLAMAMVLVAAGSASADPLVYVSLLGRVQGSGLDYGSTVAVHAGDTLEYQIRTELAPLGTHWELRDIRGYTYSVTTTSLVPGVDGISNFKFNLAEAADQPIQVDFSSPVSLADGWWGDTFHIGWYPGTVTPRGSSTHDIMNIRPIQNPGVWVGVPAVNTPASVLVASGTALVTALGSGGASTVYVSDSLPIPSDTTISSVIKINGGTGLAGYYTDTDSLLGFNNLQLTPEPATLTILLVGGAVVAARRRTCSAK